MSKLVSPWPLPQLTISDDVCWWRIALIDRNEDWCTHYVTRDGDDDMNTTSWFTVEWFDGLDIVLDAGLDAPTVFSTAFTYIAPIDYFDLLAVERPTPRAYRIGERGVRAHPGMKVIPDLDRSDTPIA